MCRMQCVLMLAALHVGLAQSWDLVIAERERLNFYTDNGTEKYVIYTQFNSKNLGAIAYDDVHNVILFVDKQTNNDALYSFNLTSKELKPLTKRNGRQIRSLAYDPVTEILFFTDTNERSINWFSLKPGSKNNVYGNLLLKMDDGIPTDIAVDSCTGYIYWMNTNVTQPSIERARFNGTDRKVVINTVSLSINTTYTLESHSLTIDPNTKKMFWCEPITQMLYSTFSADLDGGHKDQINRFTFSADGQVFANPSNTMTVSKNGLISRGWCSSCYVWEVPKTKTNLIETKKLFSLYNESPVSIAANYKIEDQIQGVKDCEALTNLVRNTSSKIATKDHRPFCIQGSRVNGNFDCKCTLGYTGERCDISVCEKYCLEGNCSVSNEGLLKCRCNPGYSGERCVQERINALHSNAHNVFFSYIVVATLRPPM